MVSAVKTRLMHSFSVPVKPLALESPAEVTAAVVSSRFSTRACSHVLVLGSLSIVIGVLWDISWHRTIGRDTFWTPAHMAIYLGGLLGGLMGGWLVLRTTFEGTGQDRTSSVGVWGFRGPFGAWVAIWGSFAMLISAPFDNWWHDAYGLDVKILSPPHSVLALGMWAVVLGALLLVLREQNNAVDAGRQLVDQWLFIAAAGILLTMGSVFLIEHSFPNQQHTDTFYRVSAATYPLYLLGIGRASKFRWGATLIAAVYMLLLAATGWVLPLFPGEPRLGPIYNHVHHFVPFPFPLLLVAPAFAIDLLRGWIGHGRSQWRDWFLVIISAVAFVGIFLAAQWFFSEFLLSSAARNWLFFGDRHWGYTETPGPWRYQYWSELNPTRDPPLTARGLGMALLLGIASARLGLWLGNWMSRVRR
jgi:hypothetical protein